MLQSKGGGDRFSLFLLASPWNDAYVNNRATQLLITEKKKSSPTWLFYKNSQKCTLHNSIMYNYAALKNTHKYKDLLAQKAK